MMVDKFSCDNPRPDLRSGVTPQMMPQDDREIL